MIKFKNILSEIEIDPGGTKVLIVTYYKKTDKYEINPSKEDNLIKQTKLLLEKYFDEGGNYFGVSRDEKNGVMKLELTDLDIIKFIVSKENEHFNYLNTYKQELTGDDDIDIFTVDKMYDYASDLNHYNYRYINLTDLLNF